MAYTPELSPYHSGILRRIAWACKMPMTKTIAEIIDHMGDTIDKVKVCEACKDKSICESCTFLIKEIKPK